MELDSWYRQVYDQYLNFIVLEPKPLRAAADAATPQLGFCQRRCCNHRQRQILNSPHTSDSTTPNQVKRMLKMPLTALLLASSRPSQLWVPTHHPIPARQCSRTRCTKLESKIREHITSSRGGSNLFSEAAGSGGSASWSSTRPLLVVLDRNVDLVPMLAHSWTYQALVQTFWTCNLTVLLSSQPRAASRARRPTILTRKTSSGPRTQPLHSTSCRGHRCRAEPIQIRCCRDHSLDRYQ